MQKIDIKKELGPCYKASAKKIEEVDVPAFRFLMCDGSGNPNTSESYQQIVEALFSVSYTAKFIIKKQQQIDFGVMPLEGLWWAEDMRAFSADLKDDWLWTMMIMQPSYVTDAILDQAFSETKQKKDLPALDKLRIDSFTEGHCAQILHVGPFSEEGPTIQGLHDYIDERGGRTGKHHEIYLSDIRRAAPARWKTIIRHPMKTT